MPRIDDDKLIQKLIDATNLARINWQKTAITDQYAAAFGGKWTVTVDKASGVSSDLFWVAIVDAGGEEILRITSHEDANLPLLFEKARRHALKVNEAIDSLMKEIDKNPE